MISEHELVVHVFAHTDVVPGVNGPEEISALWTRCCDALDLSDPIPRRGHPVVDPAELGGRRPDPVVHAVRQRTDTHVQAVLREHHDVLNLSVMMAVPSATWDELEQQLGEVLGEPTPAVIGTAWLYLGKDAAVDDGPRPLPLTQAARSGPRRGHELESGICLWEVSDRVDRRAERRLVVLALPDRDGELSDWTWSNGHAGMPRFARYLMHTAKLRFELRVHAGLEDVGVLCRAVEAAVARRDEQELRARQFAIAHRLFKLRMMRRTVEIARANAISALGRAATGDAADPIGDDRALADHFLDQLEDDIAYLETTMEGARQMTRLQGPQPPRTHAPTFGIVTAMSEEFAAVRFMLENEVRVNVPGDRANYFVGTMPSTVGERPHVVVVTLLVETATNAAADGCANLIRSFGTVNCVVMSGVAAGVPRVAEPARHVRLGDVVVATWGIVDYDHVVDRPEGRSLRQSHPRPSPLLKQAVNLLRTEERMGRRAWEEHLASVIETRPDFGRPSDDTDVVYDSEASGARTVAHPDRAASGHREGLPKVHEGRIGSADRSLRDLRKRDALAAEFDLLAFEMEGTGIGKSSFAGGLEWHVVRGISDYGDSRHGHIWRNYAALTAAAYVRAMLSECPPIEERGGRTRPA